MEYKKLVVLFLAVISNGHYFCGGEPYRELAGNEGSVRWVPRGDVILSDLHPGAYAGGKKFYIARIPYLDGVIPGKVYPDESDIFFGYDGKELKQSSGYELLVYPRGALKWIEVTNGSHIPPNPFEGGSQPRTLEPLCICRAWVNPNTLCLGKYLRSEKTCRVPYDWVEKIFEHFDILVWNEGEMGGMEPSCLTSSGSSAAVIVLSIFVALLLFALAGIMYYFRGRYSCMSVKRSLRLVEES